METAKMTQKSGVDIRPEKGRHLKLTERQESEKVIGNSRAFTATTDNSIKCKNTK